MNKKVVYTSIYGEKSILGEPYVLSEGFDHICFTDNKDLKSKNYKIIYSEPMHSDPCRAAKIFKVLPHKYLANYDISIWMDASARVVGDLNDLLRRTMFDDLDICLFQHEVRDCIYDEAAEILRLDFDDPDLVMAQIKRYIDEGFPKNNNLAVNAFMIRRHNNANIIKLNEMWWEEISNYSRRDQISFMYCLWKNHINYGFVPRSVDIRRSNWFGKVGHRISGRQQYSGKY